MSLKFSFWPLRGIVQRGCQGILNQKLCRCAKSFFEHFLLPFNTFYLYLLKKFHTPFAQAQIFFKKVHFFPKLSFLSVHLLPAFSLKITSFGENLLKNLPFWGTFTLSGDFFSIFPPFWGFLPYFLPTLPKSPIFHRTSFRKNVNYIWDYNHYKNPKIVKRINV